MPNLNECASRVRTLLREAARFPLLVFVIVTSGVLAWLGVWYVWRAGQWVFSHYLERPW